MHARPLPKACPAHSAQRGNRRAGRAGGGLCAALGLWYEAGRAYPRSTFFTLKRPARHSAAGLRLGRRARLCTPGPDDLHAGRLLCWGRKPGRDRREENGRQCMKILRWRCQPGLPRKHPTGVGKTRHSIKRLCASWKHPTGVGKTYSGTACHRAHRKHPTGVGKTDFTPECPAGNSWKRKMPRSGTASRGWSRIRPKAEPIF